MTTTTSPQATYRKTSKGEWVVMAPASTLRPGQTITVTKKNGTSKVETIAKVGKPFAVGGTQMAYGYLTARETSARPASRHERFTPRNRKACITDGNCSSFGNGRNCGGHDCDGF
jgi:hypothetical protein